MPESEALAAGDGEVEALAAKLLVMGFDGAGDQPPEHAKRLIQAGVGGVILLLRNIESPEQVAELCRNLKREAGDRPLLIMVDQVGSFELGLGLI
jgi:beta-N-acetylhexosaminidase